MFKALRNLIGKIFDFGYCPNCNDYWNWKKPGAILYRENSSVLICKECLSNPEKLDPEKVVENLKIHGWDKEKLKLIKKAITDFKTQHSST